MCLNTSHPTEYNRITEFSSQILTDIDAGKSFGKEFNLSESELFRNLFPNQFKKRFESRLIEIG